MSDLNPLDAMVEPPWYRQFWPWFLFGLPGVVVIAGLTTWWIAARHADQLVADDYYQSGLTINREIGMRERAAELGISAALTISGRSVSVELSATEYPPALQLLLSHPLDANQDQVLSLAATNAGHYRSQLDQPLQYRWFWTILPLGEPQDATWRLDGEVTIISPDEQ
jgi:hypothetical protein